MKINKSDTFFVTPFLDTAQAGIQSFIDYGTVFKSAVIIAWTELVIAAAAWYEFW